MADPQELRAAFAGRSPYSIGIEDEVMVLDPETFELVPRAEDVLALLDGDPKFKPELPASQLEIMTGPHPTAREAGAELLELRRRLATAAEALARFAAAGVHPFSPGVGPVSDEPRYRTLAPQYGCIAERELVCALHVHVFLGDPDRALGVYNASRSYLPLLAALSSNAPYYEGIDSGLTSVRPKIATLLPRQGVPPAIDSWQEYADMLAWGASTITFPDPTTWWWELRLHPKFGTLEFRVPDAQSTVTESVAVASVIHALVAWLGWRHDSGEELPTHPRWQIEENRWLACRDGVDGEMGDLDTGQRRRTHELLDALLVDLEPVAHELGDELESAKHMIEANGARCQRAVASKDGVRALGPWLAGRFDDPLRG